MAGLLAALTDDLVELDFGPVTEDERTRTRAWVVGRVAGAGQVTRAGLAVAGLVVAAGVVLTTGRPYQALSPERRRAVARRLAATRLPVAGEYVKAIRSLAVAYLFDLRHA